MRICLQMNEPLVVLRRQRNVQKKLDARAKMMIC